MSANNFHESFNEFGVVKTSSNRSFGLTFVVVFTILGGLPLIKHHNPHASLLLAAGLMLTISLLQPGLLTIPNKLWTKLGLLMGKIVTPIVLGMMFYVLLTPMALLLRLCGKDLLSLKLSRGQASYWVERAPPGPEPESLRNQY